MDWSKSSCFARTS